MFLKLCGQNIWHFFQYNIILCHCAIFGVNISYFLSDIKTSLIGALWFIKMTHEKRPFGGTFNKDFNILDNTTVHSSHFKADVVYLFLGLCLFYFWHKCKNKKIWFFTYIWRDGHMFEFLNWQLLAGHHITVKMVIGLETWS